MHEEEPVHEPRAATPAVSSVAMERFSRPHQPHNVQLRIKAKLLISPLIN